MNKPTNTPTESVAQELDHSEKEGASFGLLLVMCTSHMKAWFLSKDIMNWDELQEVISHFGRERDYTRDVPCDGRVSVTWSFVQDSKYCWESRWVCDGSEDDAA